MGKFAVQSLIGDIRQRTSMINAKALASGHEGMLETRFCGKQIAIGGLVMIERLKKNMVNLNAVAVHFFLIQDIFLNIFNNQYFFLPVKCFW